MKYSGTYSAGWHYFAKQCTFFAISTGDGSDGMCIDNLKPISETNTWVGAELADRESWTHELTQEMVDEVAEATRGAINSGHGYKEVRRENFTLPKTSELIDLAHADLEDGRGFAVISGWPVDEFSYQENVTAFCGVGAHIGKIIIQNYEGDAIVDVRDEGVPYSHQSRGYRSNKYLPFHSDGADLVALLCLNEAVRGGQSLLVSATRVYNIILKENPDVLDILGRGFYHHRRGQHDAGEPPLSKRRIPVFAFANGYLHCCYNRNPIEWAEKEGITLTNEEKAALDYFDSILERPEMQVETGISKGDMQFLNNFVILHSRTEYEDGANRRHLVRLWMENHASKRMGESLLDLYVPGTSRYHAAIVNSTP